MRGTKILRGVWAPDSGARFWPPAPSFDHSLASQRQRLRFTI